MKLICTAASLLFISLSGCASSIVAYKNPTLLTYYVDKPALHAVTGERRFALVLPKDAAEQKVRFCAESLPEVAASFTGKTDTTIKPTKVGELGINDSATMALVQTFSRTEIAEVLRQLGWQTCQAWAQHVLTDAEYAAELKSLLASGRKVIETRATLPIVK